MVVTIFHRIAATKDAAGCGPTATPVASRTQVPGVHSSAKSLKVVCPVAKESIDVCLVDATGKQLITGVVELLDVVSFDSRRTPKLTSIYLPRRLHLSFDLYRLSPPNSLIHLFTLSCALSLLICQYVLISTF